MRVLALGGTGIVRDQGTATVAASSIGSAATMLETMFGSSTTGSVGVMLETDIGQGEHGAPSATPRPLAIEANAGPPRLPGSVAPPHRHRASGAEGRRTWTSGTPEKRW